MRVVRIYDEPHDVYGGRAHYGVSFTDSIYCKPKKIASPGIGRVAMIERFRKYWYAPEQKWIRERSIKELPGKAVACWCKPLACHLDVVAEYVNGYDPAEDWAVYDQRMVASYEAA